MEFLINVISESQALRQCNLPASPRWRNFLRGKLPHTQTGGSFLYDEQAVEALANKVSDFAAEIISGEERKQAEPAPTRSQKTRLVDRNGPSVSL